MLKTEICTSNQLSLKSYFTNFEIKVIRTYSRMIIKADLTDGLSEMIHLFLFLTH